MTDINVKLDDNDNDERLGRDQISEEIIIAMVGKLVSPERTAAGGGKIKQTFSDPVHECFLLPSPGFSSNSHHP